VALAAQEAPWRSDLAALEQQLKTEFHASPASSSIGPQSVRVASSGDAETLRRVRALLDESEKRQQRELALRVAEVLRDVNAQRQADLIKIDRNLDGMQNKLGVEVFQQRQSLNYFMRVNQRQ
jgi:CheY-like chemotaxis protein